jgi:hypothetical protein
MEPYRSYYPHAGLLLETTESVASRVLLLPNGTAVGPSEITEICGIIRLAVNSGLEVSARLASTAGAFAVVKASVAAVAVEE